MQSAEKTKVLLALSMAVAATLGAKATHGATLTLYYDNIEDVTTGVSYSYASVGGSYSSIPTTINIKVGDTFEFGIDAVVTNNVNPQAGKIEGTPGHNILQPSYLGLAVLGIAVPSSDFGASMLAPNTSGPNGNTFGASPDYNDSVSLNNAAGTETIVGSNNGATPAPNWANYTQGDVLPMSPTAAGDVGDRFLIFQGNGPESNTPAGLAAISQYGALTATYGNATDFFDSLSYAALAAGTVTLSPYSSAAVDDYWVNTVAGSSTVAPVYSDPEFTNPGDVIGTLPPLVINILPVPEPTTLGLLVLGGLGLLTRRPRRRKWNS